MFALRRSSVTAATWLQHGSHMAATWQRHGSDSAEAKAQAPTSDAGQLSSLERHTWVSLRAWVALYTGALHVGCVRIRGSRRLPPLTP